MDNVAPVFVKIEEYKEVLDVLDVIKNKISGAEGMLKEIKQLKDEEDRELLAWSASLDDITKKIETIDHTVFGKR